MMNSLPKKVSIVEVGPRDGLQNESATLTTELKVNLVQSLVNAGVNRVEAGSFVSPKWVPQMADSAAVFDAIERRDGVSYSALTPNLRGYQSAIEANANEVAVFGAASEAFSQKNINCSIEESLERFSEIFARAKEDGVKVRGYVSCVLGCPYQGNVSPQAVAHVAGTLYQMGCYEISLGDTIGTGTPIATKAMLEAVLEVVPREAIAVHFHDTYGQALSNILTSLQMGIATIDSAVAGLGGCPYAKGASGNVATEDVLYMMNGMGIETGISLTEMVKIGTEISAALNKKPASKVTLALGGKASE